jgi:hypothetical protein
VSISVEYTYFTRTGIGDGDASIRKAGRAYDSKELILRISFNHSYLELRSLGNSPWFTVKPNSGAAFDDSGAVRFACARLSIVLGLG